VDVIIIIIMPVLGPVIHWLIVKGKISLYRREDRRTNEQSCLPPSDLFHIAAGPDLRRCHGQEHTIWLSFERKH
jgi:hypothetical protein